MNIQARLIALLVFGLGWPIILGLMVLFYPVLLVACLLGYARVTYQNDKVNVKVDL